MVTVKDVTKSFITETGTLQILYGVSFIINSGEMVALVGASGAGKTTLLQVLGGLDSYTSGHIEINGREIGAMKERELSLFRSKYIGFVFQFHHLLPDFTALENVIMPGLITGKNKRQCIDRGKYLLSAMGLDKRFTHLPSELSGGERQRIALARALFNEPKLILADEPTGNLDSKNSMQLLELITKTNIETQQTYLIASHSEHIVSNMQRVLHIEDGCIKP